MGISVIFRILLLGFVLAPTSLAQPVDPCGEGADVTVVPHPEHESPRSVNYTTPTDGEEIYCDRVLTTGWYIFMAPENHLTPEPKSLDMPTECVDNYRCGTRYTMWMQDRVPAFTEGIVEKEVCLNYKGSCCAHKVEIKVRRCETGLVYYYLVPAPGCPARYCFGDLSPCPSGEGSATGFSPGCLAATVPVLNVNPTLEIEQGANSFQYNCSLLDENTEDQMTYEITWVFELNTTVVHTEEVKATNRQVAGILTSGKLENIGNYFGNNILCKVRSFLMKGNYSDIRSSNHLFIGIEIVNYKDNTIELNEGEELELELRMHTPYLDDEYPLQLVVMVPPPDGPTGGAHCPTGEQIPQLAYSLCTVDFTTNDFNQLVKMKVKATMDNKIEEVTPRGDSGVLRTIQLSTSDVVFGHTFWSKYVLPPIKILVKDVDGPVATCRSVNDPHMKTFDGVPDSRQSSGRRRPFLTRCVGPMSPAIVGPA